jgi:hypothetical protein
VVSKRLTIVLSAFMAVLLLWPSRAAAQRHYVSHAHYSGVVVVGGGFGYYHPYFYDPFFWGYPGWYPGWYAGYPAYPVGYWPGYRYASARIEATPKKAEVYIDGYYAGLVDDFDGVFQRLDVPPGQHDVELYLDGYKPFKQKVLFRAGDTIKLKAALEPLPAGETAEPRPVAPARPAGPPPGQYQGQPPPEGEYPPPPPPPGRTRPLPQGGVDVRPQSGFGTLAIRVQPGDATVVIDGERWDSPEGGSRLQVQLSAGPHRVEIQKDGFKTYSTSVTIRPGATENLNVSLSPGGGQN